MNHNQDSNSGRPNFMPPPNGNSAHSTMQTLMQFLRFPGNDGVAHPFLKFHEDLQSILRALAPWQLALLGYHAAVARLWNDEALQQHQANSAARLIPEHLRELSEAACFSQPEKIPNAQELGFPMDAWCWLFRQDPFEPRQSNGPSGPATSVQAATVSSEHPELPDEQPRPDYPSKRPRMGAFSKSFLPAETLQEMADFLQSA